MCKSPKELSLTTLPCKQWSAISLVFWKGSMGWEGNVCKLKKLLLFSRFSVVFGGFLKRFMSSVCLSVQVFSSNCWTTGQYQQKGTKVSNRLSLHFASSKERDRNQSPHWTEAGLVQYPFREAAARLVVRRCPDPCSKPAKTSGSAFPAQSMGKVWRRWRKADPPQSTMVLAAWNKNLVGKKIEL